MPPENTQRSLQVMQRLCRLLVCQQWAKGLGRVIERSRQKTSALPGFRARPRSSHVLRSGFLVSRLRRRIEQAQRHGLEFRLFLLDGLGFLLSHLFRRNLKQGGVKGQREALRARQLDKAANLFRRRVER